MQFVNDGLYLYIEVRNKTNWLVQFHIRKSTSYTVVTYVHTVYVTGYWKTDHNITLGQLHFIGPANSHTHALFMHCCITGLG